MSDEWDQMDSNRDDWDRQVHGDEEESHGVVE
jgi:hypothetical protein